MSNTPSSLDKARKARPGVTPAEKAPPKAPLAIPTDESVAGEEDPGASLDMDVDVPALTPTPGGKKP